MQVFNLSRTSKLRVNSAIDKEYGGRIGFLNAVRSGAIGIGKLRYHHGIAAVDEQKNPKMKYNANIEIYPDGLGLYAYNVDDNYITLIHKDEIDYFCISKALDVIKPAEFSFFTKMKNLGMDYYKCKYMLLDHEIVDLHDVSVDIHLKHGDIIHSTIRRYHPYKHQAFFTDNTLGVRCILKIQEYLELDQDESNEF